MPFKILGWGSPGCLYFGVLFWHLKDWKPSDITWHLIYSSYIHSIYSSNICLSDWGSGEGLDTLISHQSIMSGLDNISVPHPPVRSWSTDTPPAAWILPGRTFESGSVWTSCWNPVGPSVDISDRRSAMLRERPELRESPPTVRKTRDGPSLRVCVGLKSYLTHSSAFSPVNSIL